MNLRFHKMQGNSRLGEELSNSQGIYCTEMLVGQLHRQSPTHGLFTCIRFGSLKDTNTLPKEVASTYSESLVN